MQIVSLTSTRIPASLWAVRNQNQKLTIWLLEWVMFLENLNLLPLLGMFLRRYLLMHKKKKKKPFPVSFEAGVVVFNSLTSGLHPLRRAVWNSSVTAFIIITSAVGKFRLIAISNQSAPISVQANIACLIFQKWLWVFRVFIGTTLIHTTGSSLWGYNTSWTAQL